MGIFDNSLRKVIAAIILATAVSASAGTYYAANSGNDSNPGSKDKPFASVKKGIESLSAGDSLLLQRGATWSVSSTPTMNDANTTIGAYGSGDRPVIDGKKAIPAPGTSGGYRGLIHVTAANVTVRDLVLQNSGGIGLRFEKVDGALADNVKVDWTYRHGIQALRSQNVIVRNCEVVHDNNGWKYHGEPAWGNGISMAKCQDVLIEKNFVHEGFGEGIDSFNGSKRVTIQDNVVCSQRALGIYMDSTHDGIIRRNLVFGTTDATYYRNGVNGAGIVLNNESYQFASAGGGSLPDSAVLKNVSVYGNLVAFTSIGMAIWGQHEATDFSNIKILNNTFIDNNTQLSSSGKKFSGNENLIANNIFLSTSGEVANYSGADISSLVTFKNNYWNTKPEQASVRSSSDVYGGIKLAKMSGWRNIPSITGVTAADFAPLTGSATIGAGTKITEAITDHHGNGFDPSNWDIGGIAHNKAAAISRVNVVPVLRTQRMGKARVVDILGRNIGARGKLSRGVLFATGQRNLGAKRNLIIGEQ